MAGELMSINPLDLQFPFELRKQISCTLQLANITESYIAFKVKTTSPKKYCVRPNIGLILPCATVDVTITMQAQQQAPPDMQCKDKFLVQSVVVTDAADQQEVSQELFNKESGKEIFETKLRVFYVSPLQASPDPKAAEEKTSLDSSNGALYESGRGTENIQGKLPEVRHQVGKAVEEKRTGFQNSPYLQEEKAASAKFSEHIGGKRNTPLQRKAMAGFSLLFVIVVGLLGVTVGYFLRSSSSCSPP